ncbi:MAG TPA: hypothetical protein VFE15_02270 [Marmoricola sp.]|jgi:hypothetical protein|nr:hypothetical protein [Marmoricola sp.]
MTTLRQTLSPAAPTPVPLLTSPTDALAHGSPTLVMLLTRLGERLLTGWRSASIR